MIQFYHFFGLKHAVVFESVSQIIIPTTPTFIAQLVIGTKRTAMFPDPRIQQGFSAPITLMASQPTPPGHVPPHRNKASIAGLMKGNQWLIRP